MLETRFPRIPGDIGHAATWPFPVLYKVVRGATAERVTTARANDGSTGLLDAFLAAGAELVQDGADGITTSCGFLSDPRLRKEHPIPRRERGKIPAVDTPGAAEDHRDGRSEDR